MANEKDKINFKRLPEIFCKECRKKKKMVYIGGNENLGIFWLRCPGCHQNYSFTLKELEEISTGKNLVEKKNNKTKMKSEKKNSKYEEYSPIKIFYIGQLIYHKVFNDFGKVIEKDKGSDIGGRIVVSFKKYGIKKLVEGMQA